MSARRILPAIALLLALLIGAGITVYLRLPDIVEAQARAALGDYGVEGLRYERLAFGRSRLRVEGLRIEGHFEGWTYAATTDAAETTFHWNDLLHGRFNAVTIDGFVATLQSPAPGPATADIDESKTILDWEDMAPGGLIDRLPLQALDIRSWRVEYTPWQAEPVVLRGRLGLEEQLEIEAESSLLERDFRLLAQTRGDAHWPQVTLEVTEQEAEVLRLEARASQGSEQRLAWTVEASLDHGAARDWLVQKGLLQMGHPAMDAPGVLERIETSGESSLALELTHDRRLDLSDLSLEALAGQLQGSLSSRHSLGLLRLPGVVESLQGEVSVDAELIGDTIEARITPRRLSATLPLETLQLPPEASDWIQWTDTLGFAWDAPVAIEARLNTDGELRIATQGAAFTLGNRHSNLRSSEFDGDLQWSLEDWGAARLDANTRLNLSLRGQPLPQLKLSSEHRGPWMTGESTLRLRDSGESLFLDIKRDARAADDPQTLALFLDSPDLAYVSASLLPLVRAWGLTDLTLALSSGSAHLESTLRIDADEELINERSELTLVDLEGVYDDEYSFSGVTLNGEWEGLSTWRSLKPFDLTVQRFNPGFDVTDTRARISLPLATSLEAPTLRIDSFSSTVFGGRVFSTEAQHWDFAARTNKVTLQASDWQLSEMVAMQSGQDIQAFGVLEGGLPITVEDDRIVIENGYLRALPPGGTIRYRADESTRALAESTPELKLATDLLSQFEYNLLSSRVELDREGNLTMGLSLEGSNPNHFEGRAVRFNINVEQNLDPLLQSLRLSDRLVQEIEQRIP